MEEIDLGPPFCQNVETAQPRSQALSFSPLLSRKAFSTTRDDKRESLGTRLETAQNDRKSVNRGLSDWNWPRLTIRGAGQKDRSSGNENGHE